VIADWQVWLFALDDGYCDEADFGAYPAGMAQMAARLLRVVDSPYGEIPAGAGWCAPGLADVRSRLAAHATPAHMKRWTGRRP
jgi:hypothetical protein